MTELLDTQPKTLEPQPVDCNEILRRVIKEQKEERKKARENLAAFCDWLQVHHPDIHEIVAEYSGSGDEGAINDGYCEDVDGELLKDDDKYDPFQLYKAFAGTPDMEDYECENLVMENLRWEWINNEGGHGSAHLMVAERSLHYDDTQVQPVRHPETVDLRG